MEILLHEAVEYQAVAEAVLLDTEAVGSRRQCSGRGRAAAESASGHLKSRLLQAMLI